jgi:MFS family permease
MFIDRRGRRILLLVSLGGMFFTLVATSGFFRIIKPDDARKGLVSTFTIVVFTLFYGIGAGPVPFTFSAEVFPLAFRGILYPLLDAIMRVSNSEIESQRSA